MDYQGNARSLIREALALARMSGGDHVTSIDLLHLLADSRTSFGASLQAAGVTEEVITL